MAGVELWRGNSPVDGKPIVLLMSKRTKNVKTGSVYQTWILRQDIAPLDAVWSGEDFSVCGDCPLRGLYGKDRGCYVLVGQAPTNIWHSWKAGNYPMADLTQVARGKVVRMGSYGDPAMVPLEVWEELLWDAKGWGAIAALCSAGLSWRVSSPRLVRSLLRAWGTELSGFSRILPSLLTGRFCVRRVRRLASVSSVGIAGSVLVRAERPLRTSALWFTVVWL